MDNDILPANNLSNLFGARNGKAWENPDWNVDTENNRRMAENAGFDGSDGWIWGWWGKSSVNQ